ncbi:MAG: Hypoxanthine-guanine phosphoribosyltransferase [Rhodocyclaceae bacterium]|nr:MAG: hypoxanthine-guanine phosphoribosyltransferase [Rhodocyclaceae bacterium]MBE7421892.1 hypoxanthine-guanine phosphoribosyltransferase [Zoogloeaceae bacterium]MBV6407955.1 Hypoxanthine-guanine phosphoribosyltransferase [Rhodocyclaceae bacterium]MCK6384351.1 hypoxanthine-guanine phosphoribosyltransferase [Rhodocyclaceae bacterium]CAG0929017.1 hypoxanthine phosphoribosyltransferase [Rhodocyclaceae bacterium]
MQDTAAAQKILGEADLIVSEQDAAAAVRRVADEVAAALRDAAPLVLSVMGGAVIFTGQLLPLLNFPLEFDYLHVTRYGDTTTGGELSWIVAPRAAIAGRTVLVVDDILDEGITLAAVKQRLLEQGARDCRIAVFADKDIGRDKPVQADFVGVRLPNRYVFGFGMDVRGAWRNLPAVYAVKGL